MLIAYFPTKRCIVVYFFHKQAVRDITTHEMIKILMLLTLAVPDFTTAQMKQLYQDGEREMVVHDYLFNDYINRHAVKLRSHGISSGKRVLASVLIAKPKLKSNGEFDIALSEGTMKIIHLFRSIEVRGRNLEHLSALCIPGATSSINLEASIKTPILCRFKIPDITAAFETSTRLQFKCKGKVVIDEIHLVASTKGIREEFDQLPFINLGHDKAVVPVQLNFDPSKSLSINGHKQLDRFKWFRYYGKPSSLPVSLEKWAIERNFYPGRQIFKIAASLEHGHGNPKRAILDEDPNNPGHPHPDFEKKLKPDEFQNLQSIYPRHYKFAMCLDDWPSFQSHDQGKGTPRLEYFEQAAQLAATYFRKQIEHSGRTATWWEVKNESTIKPEWYYHFTRCEGKNVDSWKHLAEFHNLVARRVHQSNPEVKIGGPASAWMQLQTNSFGSWKNQVRFMELTKDDLDFYSHHFYEKGNSIGAERRLTYEYDDYLLGRLETLLDMFEAHGVASGNIKPMIISEYGTLNNGMTETDYWERLRTYSAYLTRFMQRPDQIDLAVPFVFLASPWDPMSEQTIFIPRHKKRYSNNISDYRLTPCQHFFNLWRDFRGSYLYLPSPHRYLKVVAVRNGKMVYLAMSNMSSSRLCISLGNFLKKSDIDSAAQRRLYKLDGKIHYIDQASVTLDRIPIEAEETTVVMIQLTDEPVPQQPLVLTKHYASTVVEKFDSEALMSISISDKKLLPAFATLNIGLYRSGGLPPTIPLVFNGNKMTIETAYAANYKEFFATIQTDIPIAQLKRENRIQIKLPPHTTVTSAHLTIGQ